LPDQAHRDALRERIVLDMSRALAQAGDRYRAPDGVLYSLTNQVSNASADGDHRHESNSALTSAVLESSSDGFAFAAAGEPIPSEP
jgi:hypothetical protein